MATIPWPYDDPYVYNKLIIGPYVMPGRAECPNGIEARRDVDVKKPKGKSGGTMTDNGCEPVKVVFEIHMWTRAHHDEWQRVFPKISPRREGATKEPFEILNAYLWEQDIKDLAVVMINPGTYDTKGKRVAKIEAHGWMPAPKAVKKGTGKPKPASDRKTPLDNYVATGINTLNPTAKSPADPSDPNSIMQALLGK